MAKKMVVVPFEMVKHLISYPRHVERARDDSDMVRKLNIGFNDDFGTKPKTSIPKMKPASNQRTPSPSSSSENDPAAYQTAVDRNTDSESELETVKPQTLLRHIPFLGRDAFQTPSITQRLRRTLFAGPYSDLKVKLKVNGVINDSGKVMTDKGNPYKNSNIDRVFDYMQHKITKKPPGTDRVIRRMQELGLKDSVTPVTGYGTRKWIKV